MKRAAEAILNCLKEQRMTQSQLALSMDEDVRVINQQLHRQKDMKVERFLDVLDHIGYRVELVYNDGIRKVSPEYANKIINDREPEGLFWQVDGERCIGIDNSEGDAFVEEFETKDECFMWLRREPCIDAYGISHNA